VNYAQDTKFHAGAHSLGTANADLMIDNSFAAINSIAIFGRSSKSSVATSFRNQFDLPENALVSAAGTYHHRLFNAGIAFLRFGDDVFNYQRVSAALGNQLGMVSLASRINRHQYMIEGLGVQTSHSLDFGGTIGLFEDILLGAEVQNILGAKIEEIYHLPTIMRLGINYQLGRQLIFRGELEKDIDNPAVLRGGINYMIVDWLSLRGGVANEPLSASGGFGVFLGLLEIDYAFANRSNLGEIHELSLQLNLSLKSNREKPKD
jgi:hypothetical protein